MNRIMRTPWWPALAGSLLAAAVVVAAPRLPEPVDVDKDAAAKADKDKADKDKADKEPAKADKDVDAYVNSLLPRITDRHDSIRDSAREALAMVGEPALPALRKLADGDDGAAAEAAKSVIARIEHGGRHHGGPEGHDGHGPWGGRPGGHWGRGGFGPHHHLGEFGGRHGRHEGFRGFMGGRHGFPGGPHDGKGADEKPGEKAGERPGPGGPRRPGAFRGPGMAVESALKDLNLDDKQKTKVEEIVKAHREKVRKEFESMHDEFEKAGKDETDKDKRREALKAQGEKMKKTFESMRADLLKEMKGVLTADQYEKFEKALPEAPPGPGGRPGFFGPRERDKE